MALIIVPEGADSGELASYSDLMSAAEAALGRSVAQGAMTTLTADLNRRLRIRQMLVDASLSSTAIPSDFLEGEILKVGGKIYQPAAVRGGQCSTYAVKNGVFVFTPAETAPDLFLRYYARLSVPTENTTNVVLDNFPDLYLYGLLFHHSRLVRDESGATAWGPSYEQTLSEVVKADVSSRMDTAPMRVKVRASA